MDGKELDNDMTQKDNITKLTEKDKKALKIFRKNFEILNKKYAKLMKNLAKL